jgi:hypothetical protein
MLTWSTRGDRQNTRHMKTRPATTCDDCFFRREGLCALPANEPCPTFRAAQTGRLTPPPQARLVPRPPVRLAFGDAA